jgi:hypothetical protein
MSEIIAVPVAAVIPVPGLTLDQAAMVECLAEGTIPTEPLHTHSFDLEAQMPRLLQIQPSIMKAIGRF